MNSGQADLGTADRADRMEGPVPASPPRWGDFAIDGAVALAPDGRSPARTGAQRATAALAARPQVGSNVQVATRVAVTATRLNVAEEVRDLLSRMARPANHKTVRLLVAIEPDITILVNAQAFRGLLSRVISDAIAETGASGGRVLLSAFPDGRTIRLIVTDQAEAADPVRRENVLRYSREWNDIPDGALAIRVVQGGGIEVALTLAAG